MPAGLKSGNTFLNRSVKEDPGASPSLATGVSHSSSSSPVPAGRPRNRGGQIGPPFRSRH